jgi:hypothetical protein
MWNSVRWKEQGAQFRFLSCQRALRASFIAFEDVHSNMLPARIGILAKKHVPVSAREPAVGVG